MLTLPIKGKWFDAIVAGEKLEEYRDYYSDYYMSRLDHLWGSLATIRYRNGYRADSPLIEVTGFLMDGEGRPEWGAEPGKRYYIHRCEQVKVIRPRRAEG